MIDHPPEVKRKIQERAYEIFEARIHWKMEGDETSDWLQAEGEVCRGEIEG